MNHDSKRLIGIKAIADYLNTSERNIYRWEKELNLPLRRMAGSSGRTVFASIKDLEKWLEYRSNAQAVRKNRYRKIGIIVDVQYFRASPI